MVRFRLLEKQILQKAAAHADARLHVLEASKSLQQYEQRGAS